MKSGIEREQLHNELARPSVQAKVYVDSADGSERIVHWFDGEDALVHAEALIDCVEQSHETRFGGIKVVDTTIVDLDSIDRTRLQSGTLTDTVGLL